MSKIKTSEELKMLSPKDALQFLKEGNQRFVDKKNKEIDFLQQVGETKGGQFPFATVLSCIDSRVPVEIVFDQGIGDIFSVRIAGNIVNEDILGSIEFATKVVGTKVIVVLGHSACGAVKGACDNVKLGNLTTLLSKIRPAVEAETTTTENRTSSNFAFVEKVSHININNSINELTAKSSVIKELKDVREIIIVGANYDISTGKVTFLS